MNPFLKRFLLFLCLFGLLAAALAVCAPIKATASEKYGTEEQIALEYVKNALADNSVKALKDKLFIDPGFIYLNDLDFDLFILEEIKDWYAECVSSGEIAACDKLSSDYVDAVIGKYLLKANQIIIRESTQYIYSKCFFESLLVHEIVHFYQGIIFGDGVNRDAAEWEAYGTQKDFLKTTCPDAVMPQWFKD